jgi:hypothetical protein
VGDDKEGLFKNSHLTSPPARHTHNKKNLFAFCRKKKGLAYTSKMATTAAAAAPSVDIDPRFEAFLVACTDPELPEEIAVQIRAGLTRQYHKPPVAEVEAILKHNATPDRVRQLVYWPTEDDAQLYPTLMQSPPAGAPEVGMVQLLHSVDP